MKFWLTCCGLILFLNSCTIFRPSATKIVNLSKQAIKEIKALEYYGKVVMEVSPEDIRIYEAAVKLLKDSTLKPVGFQVKLNLPENDRLVCTQDSFYYLRNHQQELHASRLGERVPMHLRNSGYRSVIGEALIHSDPFKLFNYETDQSLTLVGAEKINGEKFWIMQIKGKTPGIGLIRQFYINQKNYLPLRVKSVYQELDQFFKIEWNATNVNYDPEFQEDEFSKPELPPGYKVVYIKAFE